MDFNYNIPSTIKVIGEFTAIDGGSSIHWSYDSDFIIANPLKGSEKQIHSKGEDYIWIFIKTDAELPDITKFYENREKDCKKAFDTIKKKKDIAHLTDLDLQNFRDVEHLLADPLIRKRAYHVISENYRVEEAEKAIRNKNFKRLGKFIKATHASLNTNFEMNFSVLNDIVSEAENFECHLGGRILTDNFFGYTLHLLEKEGFDDFKSGMSYMMYKNHKRAIECFRLESQQDIENLEEI